MNNKNIGVIFCFISAFLIATNYICISLLSLKYEWGMAKHILGNTLTILSIISLVIGIIYLIGPRIIELFMKNKN